MTLDSCSGAASPRSFTFPMHLEQSSYIRTRSFPSIIEWIRDSSSILCTGEISISNTLYCLQAPYLCNNRNSLVRFLFFDISYVTTSRMIITWRRSVDNTLSIPQQLLFSRELPGSGWISCVRQYMRIAGAETLLSYSHRRVRDISEMPGL